MLKSLANVLKISGCDVPNWIFSVEGVKKEKIKSMKKYPVKREDIHGAAAYYVIFDYR